MEVGQLELRATFTAQDASFELLTRGCRVPSQGWGAAGRERGTHSLCGHRLEGRSHPGLWASCRRGPGLGLKWTGRQGLKKPGERRRE